MTENRAVDVLEFWFGPADAEPDARSDLWWGQVEDQERVDRQIEQSFGELVRAGLEGELSDWRERPDDCVAYVITLDQFPRHIYRGTADAFAGDDYALAASQKAWQRRYHEEISVPRQLFLSMPMMHSEDRDVQRQATEVFEWIADRAPDAVREMAEASVDHARRHRDLIERFGRFPHRNPILGRETTDAERAHLEETGNWYGQKADE